ncbi:integral membrane protein [Lacticaseibacillus zeae DSM 20178 = KCTC 3804]|uniref:Integral membrane protein n=7 Tax=Lacticaseibacillus TaxID=2759736 RepID=A0A0R1EUH2_LACZE|nr:integral membrane protein [Lacticaseibacillus zeae DSM 20178 = KCTC 3804]
MIKKVGNNMLNRKSFGFDWGQFITGILFLVAAFVVLRYPLATLRTVTFIFAVVAIIRGIAVLAGFSTLRQFTGRLAWISLIMGIFDLVIGLIFLLNSGLGVATITMMFAIWFLVDSVGSLFNVGHLRVAGTGWFVVYLILDILAVIVSLMLFMQPVIAAVTLVTLLAMFFVLFGIECIVIAFARRNI